MKELQKRLGLTFHYVERTVREWHSIAVLYPASQEHHHAYRGGLWEHSVSVALRMLDSLEVYMREGEKEGDFIRRKTKLMLYTTLTGLFHDAGKVGMYLPDTEGFIFHPFLSYRPSFDSYKRSPVSYRDNYLSLIVMGACISKDEVFLKSEFFDWAELNLVGEAIIKEHSQEASENVYLLLLRKCDTEDVSEVMESQKDIYEKALEYLRRLVRTLRNGEDFFWLGEWTGIVSPRVVKDLFYAGFVEEVKERVDEMKIYQVWQERGYSDGLREVLIVKPDGSSFRKPLQLLFVRTDLLFTDKDLEKFQKYGMKGQEKKPLEVEL